MLRKLLTILAIFLLLSYQTAPVFAQVVTPTDTPAPIVTPSPTDTPTPTSSPTPTVDPNATLTPTPTLDPNATVTPTPTIDPNTVTPTPTPVTSITNTGTVANNATSSAISGDNTVTASPSADPTATPSATPSPDVTADPTNSPNNGGNGNNNPQQQVLGSSTQSGGGNATVNTGNAVAVSNTDNSINTNSINSQFVNQTINIFVTQNGNLDLSVPFNIISNLITEQNNTSPQINLLMNQDKSYAVVTNNIVNNANSGNNSITSGGSSSNSGQMIINTGNAYSVVSLTNKVNFTIVDSVVHVITINIFGTLNGNIILPDLSKASLCGSSSNCGYDASIVNEANVTNNVDSTAVSGGNTITQTASGSANIKTGNAVSIINLDNIVNTNVLGVPFEHLFINTFGLWNGNFLGWGGFNPMPGDKSYAFNGIFQNGANQDCPNCFNNLNIQNNATVTNNVTSDANSGGNNITGGGNENIKTGSAYSAVQLLNFVNANFIRTFGFFGFINIFGDWNGSIGNAGDFVTPTPTPSVTPEVMAANTGSSTCATTGDPVVETKVKSNINNFINPGDTSLFYVGIKNTGPNDFVSEKVTIVLATNGKGIGGTILNIKKPITSGKSELVTVGLTISKLAPDGKYTAYVTTEGITCDGKTASAKASTDFVVSGNVLGSLITTSPTPTPIVGKVLGVHTTTASAHKNNWLIYVLLLIVLAYLVIRGIRSRAVFVKLIKENMSLKERLATLRMLLL